MTLSVTQSQFNSFRKLTDGKDYLEISFSTDRSDKTETLKSFIDFTNKAKACCEALSISYESIPPMEFDFDDSDHETVCKRLYFWPQNEMTGVRIFHKTYGYGIIDSINLPDDVMTVKFEELKEPKTLGINRNTYEISELDII